MSRRKKINKLKVAIVVFALIVFFMSVTGLGRFVYNAARDRYLSSKKFYFTSDLLTPNGNITPHLYENWDGIGIFEIDINMFSKKNNLERYDGVLKYSVAIEYNDSEILCAIDPDGFKGSTGHSVTDYYTNGEGFDNRKLIPAGNEEKLTLYVKPAPGKKLEIGDEFSIKVTAYTSDPYKKTIRGEFKIRVQDVAFSVEDEEDVPYVILNVRNTRNYESDVTINFDKDIVKVDMTSDAYVNKKSIDTDGTIVESLTITMPKESSKDIKFYKTNPTDPKLANEYAQWLEIFSIEREKND